MANPSALAALRSGRWRRVEVGALGVAAAASALADLSTTYLVLAGDGGEANVVLVALAEVHLWAAMGAFAAFGAAVVGLSWLSLGWLSTVAGTYAVLSMGAGGVNNAVGFAFAVWPLTWLPVPLWVLIHVVIPPASVVVALAWTYAEHGRAPWREAAAVLPAVTVATVGLAAVA